MNKEQIKNFIKRVDNYTIVTPQRTYCSNDYNTILNLTYRKYWLEIYYECDWGQCGGMQRTIECVPYDEVRITGNIKVEQ